jgi:serine/threonine protein kinase
MAEFTKHGGLESTIIETVVSGVCKSPHVIKYRYDYGRDVLMAPQYDRDLADCIDSELKIDHVSVAADVIAGIGEIHSKGFMHCDIKLSNILAKIAGGVVNGGIICDFDLAQAAGENRKNNAYAWSFRPAEVDFDRSGGSSPVTPASDMYAVGVVMYEIKYRKEFHRRTGCRWLECDSCIVEILERIYFGTSSHICNWTGDQLQRRNCAHSRRYLDLTPADITKILGCDNSEYDQLLVEMLSPHPHLRPRADQALARLRPDVSATLAASPVPQPVIVRQERKKYAEKILEYYAATDKSDINPIFDEDRVAARFIADIIMGTSHDKSVPPSVKKAAKMILSSGAPVLGWTWMLARGAV